MSEPAPVWQCADDNAVVELQRAEANAQLGEWAARLAETLAVVHGSVRNVLPHLADDITLIYARLLLEAGLDSRDDACANCAACDDEA